MKKYTVGLLLLFLFAISPLSVTAQMFSVEDSSPNRVQPLGLYTTISAGWEIGDFNNRQSGINLNDDYSFNDNIYRIRLESPGIDVGLGFGGRLSGMDSNSYVNVVGRLHNNLNLYMNDDRSFILRAPIQITTDLKRVQRNNIDSEFQQSSFIFGAGLMADVRIAENIDFSVKGTPNYGFSFSQGNLFGGSLFRTDGRTHLLFRNLFGDKGLSVGYHFDFRRYDIDGDQNDYDYTSHSFSIGLIF
ncbi:hypothetical protein [Rhodohalobacter halophilus]|uniref:hypothetical protein n=1 Tax=Rhodohalobacter halophilus TaxID=1812810 RepID=UPI00083FBFE0|nr:hypothetical protein [Rhodohalobacter halophilus]